MSTPAEKFMKDNQLSFRAVRVASRPDGLGDIFPASGPMVNESWAKVENKNRRHFRVEFRTLANDFALVTFFSQGSAHKEAPTAAEVLECLANDASAYDNGSDVLEFALELGYDLSTTEGVNRCRRVYAACEKSHNDLSALLGDAINGLLHRDFYVEEWED